MLEWHFENATPTFSIEPDMMARIFQEVRQAGASNASTIYYLFLGYLECMKSLEGPSEGSHTQLS